jgi:hypothetical protein
MGREPARPGPVGGSARLNKCVDRLARHHADSDV